MGKDTSINWADSTLNLGVGCRKVDEACQRCYMFRIQKRINEQVVPFKAYNVDAKVDELESWPKSKKIIFVNSMTDTFGEFVDDTLRKMWHKFIFNAKHFEDRNFLLLTKRIGTANRFYRLNPKMLTDNIWIGCSIGEKARLWRLGILRKIPAKVRFVSFEPLIEDMGIEYSLEGIHWAIGGGESDKHKPRPMEPRWAERIRVKAEKHGTAFWFKQMGGIGGDGAGGDKLNGHKYQEYPEVFQTLQQKAHEKVPEALSSGQLTLASWQS